MPDSTLGFAAKFKSYCSGCESTISEDFLCKRVNDSSSSSVPFEVNIPAVLAFRGIGCGFSWIRERRGLMNMPYHLSQDGYTSLHEKLNVGSISTFNKIQKKSNCAKFTAYGETQGRIQTFSTFSNEKVRCSVITRIPHILELPLNCTWNCFARA